MLAGLERDETPDSLRRLIDRTGVRYDTEFTSSSQLRYASGVLRAAAGNHEAAIEELRGCALDHPAFGGENPAMLPWRSAAALSLAELGRHDEARALAADEVRRAQSFGAPRAIGIALRAQALVGPPRGTAESGWRTALAVLASSPARLEHARVLVDLGATFRAAGQRTAAREPLLEGLALAARCGARALERRARAELAAIGVRPRTTDRAGADSLTPSERRVVELAAAGGTNREIAQTLFVTEKTVETHLGRAFRKLDVSSRRQLPDVLARARRLTRPLPRLLGSALCETHARWERRRATTRSTSRRGLEALLARVGAMAVQEITATRSGPVFDRLCRPHNWELLDGAGPLPLDGEPLEDLLERCGALLGAGRRTAPAFFGYVLSPAAPIGVAADLLTSAADQNVTSWRSAPAAMQLERTTIRWLGEFVGFASDAEGLFVSGGSMANLTALLVALRSRSAPDADRRALIAYASQEAHFSIEKAAAAIGVTFAAFPLARAGGSTSRRCAGRSPPTGVPRSSRSA